MSRRREGTSSAPIIAPVGNRETRVARLIASAFSHFRTWGYVCVVTHMNAIDVPPRRFFRTPTFPISYSNDVNGDVERARAGFRFTVRNRGMHNKSRCRSAEQAESVVMNSEARAIKNRMRENAESTTVFSSVALSCHREIVPEVILYYYDVYCNNKYYISTFYKSYVFITAAVYLYRVLYFI